MPDSGKPRATADFDALIPVRPLDSHYGRLDTHGAKVVISRYPRSRKASRAERGHRHLQRDYMWPEKLSRNVAFFWAGAWARFRGRAQ